MKLKINCILLARKQAYSTANTSCLKFRFRYVFHCSKALRYFKGDLANILTVHFSNWFNNMYSVSVSNLGSSPWMSRNKKEMMKSFMHNSSKKFLKFISPFFPLFVEDKQAHFREFPICHNTIMNGRIFLFHSSCIQREHNSDYTIQSEQLIATKQELK